MTDVKKHLALQAWNFYLAGPREWNLGLAVVEDAPEDAIYRNSQGEWVRKSDLLPGHPFHEYYNELVSKGAVK